MPKKLKVNCKAYNIQILWAFTQSCVTRGNSYFVGEDVMLKVRSSVTEPQSGNLGWLRSREGEGEVALQESKLSYLGLVCLSGKGGVKHFNKIHTAVRTYDFLRGKGTWHVHLGRT